MRPFEFTSRMNKYVLIPYYLDFLSINGNLKENLLKVQMNGFEQTLNSTSKFWKEGISVERKIEEAEKIKIKISKQYENEIENYFPILYNQALIISCTIFDLFLFESYESIVNQAPALEILLKKTDVTSDKNIEKILKNFDYSGIKDKIEKIERLKINMDIIFKLKLFKNEVQEKYPDGRNYLFHIYSTRNDIVHRNLLPIKKYSELSDMTTYLQSFMIEFAYHTGNQFNINTDIPGQQDYSK